MPSPRVLKLLGFASANSHCSGNSNSPKDLLPGSLSVSHTRCGKPTCHCAQGQGHPAWSLTFMAAGKKRVERIPKDWVDDVRRRVDAGRAFQDALREVLTANAELLVLRRKQQPR
jgi:uncharacterized protein DUF6788